MASVDTTAPVPAPAPTKHELDCDKILSIQSQHMSQYDPTMLCHQRMNVVPGIKEVSSDVRMKTHKLKLPEIKLNTAMECDEVFLQTCFIAFLARINCTSVVHVGMLASKDITGDDQSLCPDIIPGIFTIDLTSDVKGNISDCVTALKTYLASDAVTDMFYQYPELRGQTRVHVPHNIVIGKRSNTEKRVSSDILHDCNMLVLFADNCKELDICYWEYPEQDDSDVVNVLKHFPTFLKSLQKSGDTAKLGDLQLVAKEEIVRVYCSLHLQETFHGKLLNLFQQQCELTPLSIAVKTTKRVFTYCHLQKEIKRLCNVLKTVLHCDTGNKPVIAVHLPKSIAYVVSILAAAKCHHAFLPLPVDLPPERLLFTIQDANVKHLITTSQIVGESYFQCLFSYSEVTLMHQIAEENIVVLNLTPSSDKIDNTKIGNEDILDNSASSFPNCCPGDFCYILYTSGSTGRPKGVKVKETSVINMARAQINMWDLGPGEVIAQFASIGFDASISEIFTSLLSGASLAILKENEQLGGDFLSAMNKMKVSTITLPPSVLNVYSPSDLPILRKVVAAGEVCSLATAIKWKAHKDCRFFNAYGPTEGTVCATCFEYTGSASSGVKCINTYQHLPIGHAIDGVAVYLFDDFMTPIPSDVVGELYIGGTGLSHGYIGHASIFTKDRFIQNPLESERSLLYKTGDLAFRNCDGTLTYVGRIDNQLKIRGHRIELSEIEEVLIQHPKVEMAVVVRHKCSTQRDLSISAFVAPPHVCISELREYLGKVLPEYMIPTYIKGLEITEFPKTLNIKLNRQHLELDETVHDHMLCTSGSDDLNEIQLLVARNWCKVFYFDESFVYTIHGQSSFRALGGNSLQLVMLIQHIEKESEKKVSFSDLRMADTIEEFADVICRSLEMQKCEVNDLQEELRELIYQDSEFDPSLLTHHASLRQRKSIECTKSMGAVQRLDSCKHPKNILISGVTGFLGAFLLCELLEKTDAHLYCMVRETSNRSGINRIIDNFDKYGLWKLEYTQRITVVISDLSQKLLGIAPDIYRSMCNTIDVVFMNAARRNFNMPYEYHRATNVEGTKQFIKFCSTGIQKYIFATSSLSVFLFPEENGNPNGRQTYREADCLGDPLLIEGGYGQSKWACERLYMHALDFLPGGVIFRPGRISGNSTSGVGPRNDLFASTIIGMNRLGCYPNMKFPYDLIPVDYCASAMVEISLQICNSQNNTYDKVYHLYNKETLPFCDLFTGMGLKPCTLQQWREQLKAASEDNVELIPLMPFFLSRFWDRAPSWPVFETTNVDRMVSDDTKCLLKPSRELLDTYKVFFGV